MALGVLWQARVCYLVHARPGQAVEAGIGSHGLVPAEQSSLGVVLLTFQDVTLPPADPSVREILADDAQSPPLAVAACRNQGWGMRRYRGGEVSLAVPIGTPVVAALGISSRHLHARVLPRAAAELQAAAARIAGLLTAATPTENSTAILL